MNRKASLRESFALGKSVVVLIVIAVVVVGGVGVYYFVTINSQGSIDSTQTSITSSIPGTSSSSLSSSTAGGSMFQGTFKWSAPLGPSGARGIGNTYSKYGSGLSASGSFSVTIDPLLHAGTGTGQGSLTEVTTGYCSGTDQVAYTFAVNGGLNTNTGNLTLIFGNASPASSTVHLSCIDASGASYESSGSYDVFSVYPSVADVRPVAGTTSLSPGDNFTLEITLG